MSKFTKKILQVLMILCVAVVLAAGIFWFGYFTQNPFQPKSLVLETHEITPEEVIDPDVKSSGRNYSDTYNEDGTVNRTISIVSMDYLDDNNEYLPIDTTVVDSENEEFAYENSTNIAKTYFKDDVDAQDFIVFNIAGDRGVEFGFVDGNTSAWKSDGNTIMYPGIYDGIDAKYTISPDIFLEELIVNEYKEIDNIDQVVKLNGIYYKEREDGSITFHDKASKNIVFSIPPPVMYELEDEVINTSDEDDQIIDEGGGQSYNFGLHYEISQVDSDTIIISKVIDEEGKEWLKNAKYPLVIDNSYFLVTRPNFLEGQLPLDWSSNSGISGFTGLASFGNTNTSITGKRYSNFVQGVSNRVYVNYRGVLSFDTSSLPGITPEMILGARLNIYIIGTRSCASCSPFGAGESPLIEGDDLKVFSGADVWTDFTDPEAMWNAIDPYYNNNSSMTYEGIIDTSGLPSDWPTYCWTSPEDCHREIDISLSSISSIGQTQIGFSDELMSTPSVYYWRGIYLMNSSAISDVWPTLEIIYEPVPEINIYRGYCDNDISRSCYQNSECLSGGVCKNDHNEPDTQYISIIDNSTDEATWELERSADGTSGWTAACTVTSGNGVNQVCGGGGVGTYTCETSKAGIGNTCLVTHTGLDADTPYYYRARTYRSDIPAGYSPYSIIQNDYTTAGVQPSTNLEFASPSWDRVVASNNMNFSTTINQLYTNYNIGVFGSWGGPSEWRYNGIVVYQSGITFVSDLHEPSSETPYIFINSGELEMFDWVISIFGGSNTMEVSLYGTDSTTMIRPNRMYYLHEFSIDTRSGNYAHKPDIFTSDWGYSRARTPSSPEIVTKTPNSIQLFLDTTPHDNTTYVNGSTTDYAMQIKEGGVWYYLNRTDGIDRAPSDLYKWGTADEWNTTGGRTFSGLAAGECFNFRAQSRNGDGIVGESDAEPWSPIVEYCTPLLPPDPPTVECNYDVDGDFAMESLMQYYAGITDEILEENNIKKPLFNIPVANALIITCINNGDGICDAGEDDSNHQCYYPDDCPAPAPSEANDYYCEVDINPTNSGTVYYHFQRRSCEYNPRANCSSWVNIDEDGVDSDVIEVWLSGLNTNLDLTCGNGSEYYEYQVEASRTDSNNDFKSAYSDIAGDHLPPCQPEVADTPEATVVTTNSIEWNWGRPDHGETIDDYALYRRQTSSQSVSPYNPGNVLLSYIQGSLISNTPHYLDIAGIGEDFRAREGALSAQSDVVYTLANNPTIDVNCSWSAGDLNNCIVDLTNHNGNTSTAPPEYCLSRRVGLSLVWEYYSFGNWNSNSNLCNWGSAYSAYSIDDEIAHDIELACGTDYTYRMQARNDIGVVTTLTPEVKKTTPICPPTNVKHTTNGISGSNDYYIRISWTNPTTTQERIYVYKNNNCSGFRYKDLTNTSTNTYIYYGTNASLNANISKSYSVCYLKEGVFSQPGTGDLNAYTSIQTPTGVSFSNVTTDTINVNRTGTLTRLSGNRLDYYMSWKNGGLGGSNPSWISGSYNDTGLSANYQYCYRVRARNNETGAYTSGDYTGYAPATIDAACVYTLAEIPTRPIRSQVDASTVKVKVRDNDGNPQDVALPANDTNYAICVTEYNIDGSVYQEGYVNKIDNTVSWLEPTEECGARGDFGVTWGTRADWGGVNGVDITGVESSKKYGFSIKARNGDGVNTNFGPEATLFLVRNNVVGWAWSSNIGWVSMNCLNLFSDPDRGFSCKTANNWGINTSFEPTREINPLEGYAWSASGQSQGAGICNGGADDGKTCFEYNDCVAPGICEGDHNDLTYDLGLNDSLLDFDYDDTTPGGPYIWALDSYWDRNLSGPNKLRRYDANSMVEILPNLDIGNSVTDIEQDKNGNIWLASFFDNSVYVINPSDLSIITTISLVDCNNVTNANACNPAYIINTDNGVNSGDMFVVNQEEGDSDNTGSISRFRITGDGSNPSDYSEVKCDGSGPLSDPATERCMVGNQPFNAYYDATSGLFLVNNEYSGNISSIPVDGPNAGNVQTLPFNLIGNYYQPYGGFARTDNNLYVAHTTTDDHLGYCSNDDSISCADNTPCLLGGGVCRDEGLWGNAAYTVISIDGAQQISWGATTEVNEFSLLRGFVYDGQLLWMSNKFDTGICKDNSSIMCIDDDDCGGTVGDCKNKETKVIQINELTGEVITSNVIAPISSEGWNNVKFFDGSVWAGAQKGYLTKISSGLKTTDVDTGLGWISLNKAVCSDDAQQGCSNDNECEGAATCIISTDVTPDSTAYGFCYNNDNTAPLFGEKYGECSETAGEFCTESNMDQCLVADEYCIYYTCQKPGDACIDPISPPSPAGWVKECRDTATANFNGETREIEGWARILSSKKQGELYTPPFTDWGWLQLGGQYDDGQGVSGEFNLTGTDIDSQLFLGEPDVDSGELSLYTLFGWGWNADISDYTYISKWLTPTNISDYSIARLGKSTAKNISMVLDSNGDPHIAWEAFDITNKYYDIYYLKLEAGKWVTITGVEYQPGAIDPDGSMLSIGHATGLFDEGMHIRFPSLVLSADNRPHLAGVYDNNIWGGDDDEGGVVFHTEWDGARWTSSDRLSAGYTQVAGINIDGLPAQVPSLKLNDDGMPNIAYRVGNSWPGDIYFKIWDGSIWNTIDGTEDSLNVSKTLDSSSTIPELVMDGDTPHIIFRDSGLVYYRWWDSSFDNGDGTFGAWVTANGDAGPYVCSYDHLETCPGGTDAECQTYCADSSDNPGIFCTLDSECDNDGTQLWEDVCLFNRCQSEDIAVNRGLRTCNGLAGGTQCNDVDDCAGCASIAGVSPDIYGTEALSFDLYDDATPGVLFRDPYTMYYRKWDSSFDNGDGTFGAWVSVTGQTDGTNLSLSTSVGDGYVPSVIIGDDNFPRVIWGEEFSSNKSDIAYKQWDGTNWITAGTIDGTAAQIPPNSSDPSAYISDTPTVQSYTYSPVAQLDRFGNPHTIWSEVYYSGQSCGAFAGDGVIDDAFGEVHDVEIDYDDNAVYLVGVSDTDPDDPNRGDHWRIEKRNFDTGDLVTGFGWYENPASHLFADIDDWDNGTIIGDTNTKEAWNIEIDDDYFYVVGGDRSDGWRIEKREKTTGDRVLGFGPATDDTGWPDKLIGVVRTKNNGYSTNGVEIKIDDHYIYLAGRDDDNNWRIEKRYKSTGELVEGFGGAIISGVSDDGYGEITSTDGYDARRMMIDDLYMWVAGHDDDNDWRIEKRLLSNGALISTFGDGGVFTGAGEFDAPYPDTDSIYDMKIDGDDIYVIGRTTGYGWLMGKLNKDTGILDTNFDDDGYLETNNRFAYGIAVSGDDLIVIGQKYDGAEYWHYEIRNKNTGEINPTGNISNGWQSGEIDSYEGYWSWGMHSDDDYFYAFGNNQGETCAPIVPPATERYCTENTDTVCSDTDDCPDRMTWRLERRWISTGILDNGSVYGQGGDPFSDCKDPKYPMCIDSYPLDYECVGGDLFYSRWTPGIVQGGVGWVEFMPAGALLGVPWVQTAFADIFGTEGVSLSPPPRGSGEYTATYLILSNGSIEGIPTYYFGDLSERPTTDFYLGGLNPLIEGSSLPFGENALSKINVEALISDDDLDELNRYGHPLELVVLGDISTNMGITPLLNGKVYHIVGDASIDNEMTFMRGDSTIPLPASKTSGNGLIVIDGDLEINANTYYETVEDAGLSGLSDITEMPSVGFIVRGNIYISPFVTEVVGAFVALDDPDTLDISEGIISTSRKNPIITPIADANDDAYISFDTSDTSYENHNLSSSFDNESLKFGQLDANTTNRTFLRFPFGPGSINDILPNSEIRNAYLNLTDDGGSLNGVFNAKIYLIDYNNVNDFTDMASGFNPASDLFDVKVSNSMTYKIDTSTWNSAAGSENVSVNIKSLIQRYVNSDEYGQSYANGETPYLGLVIKEGDADVGDFRSFYSQEYANDKAPELVVEYSPRRTLYSIQNTNNDVHAWNNIDNPTNFCWETEFDGCNADDVCLDFGQEIANPTSSRIFYRFLPDTNPLYTSLPDNAQILEAHLRATNSSCATGSVSFQMRQGLIDDVDYDNGGQMTTNPYNKSLTQDVFEVAEIIPTGEWGNGETFILQDISTLIQSWVDSRSPDYVINNSVGLRLRRGNDSTEGTPGVGEYRSISDQATRLEIDYLVPLQVSGLFIAQGYNFDRKYTKDLAPAERIVYDGRVVANTPPGLADFSKALPIYQKVAP